MTDAFDSFNVAVPQDELDAKPSFLLPAGWYGSTLQAGAEVVSNDNGWAGIRIPFAGFTNKKDGKVYERERRFQVTTAHENAKTVAIGRADLVRIAVAFGLAEDATDGNGKSAKRLTAKNPAEFVEQLNAVAGSPCDVYLVAKKRKRDGQIVMRDDGTGPVMDNEITRVAALGEGK